MKKIFCPPCFVISLLASALVLTACHSGGRHDHDHEGHDHEAEAHDHDHDGHDHEHEGHGHEGIITLTPEQIKAASVVVEAVEPGDYAEAIRVSGQVTASQGDEAAVIARSSGVVHYHRKHLTEGVAVRLGETLATVSAEGIAGGDDVARNAQALDAATRVYERAKRLYADTLISRAEFERREADYRQARLAAGAGNRSGKGGSAITSPLGGYIRQVIVREGEYVQAGQTVATVTRSCNLQLRAEVPERYFAMMDRFRSANFEMSYGGGVYSLDELHGHLVARGREADGGSGYIPVTFEFAHHSGIVPGAFADIWLLTETRHGVISVPTSALTEQQGVYYVYVEAHEAGEYERREVRIGGNNGRRTEILAGLKAGDRVVTAGVTQVRLAGASNALPAHTHEH